MDSARTFRNGSELEVPTISRRTRRGKMKSSVNMRLNPEFDLKSVVSRNGISNGKNHDELDPKTMDFDTLAKLLHPTFIFDYFYRILHFLKSDDVKLCFPDLAPYKEAFLLKLVTDNTNFASGALSDASASIGCNILEVVEKNRKVFKWVHAYEFDTSQRASGVILVYKKLDITKIQNENLKRLDNSPTSPMSLASSLEDMSLNSQNRQAVTPGFRISMLNTTLKFIKDNTQLTLEYPEMQPAQAHFIHSLISPRNIDVGLGFKSIYGPISEALVEFEKKFVLKKVFTRSSDDVFKISLQKVPNGHQNGGGNQVSLENPKNVTNKRPTKAERDKLNKEKMLRSISGQFIYSALKQLLDFYEDAARASLDFTDINANESRFVECMTSLSRSSEYYKLFDDRCVVLMKIIARYCRSPKYKVKMNVGKLCRKTGFRTVSFHKTPCYDSVSTQMPTRQHVASTPKPIQNGVHNDTEDTNIHNTTSIEITRYYDTSPKEKVRPRSTSREAKSRQTQSIITFQSAGSQIIDANKSTTKADGSGDIEANINSNSINSNLVNKDKDERCLGRKDKLIMAMSTPMESDIGEKMMRRMGWEGGALGVRGEGIIEPIIPALHLAPGAGLGHVKPIQTNKPKAHDFRVHFLSSVLSFLQSTSLDTTISYQNPLSKREARFVKPAITAFNNRGNVGLSRSEEVKLVNKIMDIVYNDKEMFFEAKIGDDKKHIQLSKTNSNTSLKKSKNKKKPRNDITTTSIGSDHSIISDKASDELTSILNDIEHQCPTRKAAKSLAYRILFLEKIKEWLQSDCESQEFTFDCVLKMRQRRFIQGVITGVNKKKTMGGSLMPIENDLFKEVRKLAGDCYLSVEFCGPKIMLQKKHYVKRFTNSALALPPPKSLDIKNTIIYTPNGIIRPGGTDCDKSGIDGDKKGIDSDKSGIDSDKNGIDSDKNAIDSDKKDIETDKDYFTQDDISETNYLSDDDDVLVIEDITIVSVSDDENVVSVDKIENDNCDKLSQTCDDIETDLELTKDDISLDISSESMLLGILERENDDCVASVKKENLDSSFERTLNDFTENYLKSEVNNNVANSVTEIKWETNEDTNTSTKRCNSDSISYISPKKPKSAVTYLSIVPKDVLKIYDDIDLIKKVQMLISEGLKETSFMPLLKCHGVQNGGLVYSCHNDFSCDWLRQILSVANFETNPTENLENYKLAMKIGSFIPITIDEVLCRLKAYYPSLDVHSWVVSNEEVFPNYVTYSVLLDENSFKCISDNNFSLFAGIDAVEFSRSWN